MRFLGFTGTVGLVCTSLLLTLAMCGAQYSSTVNGETVCTLPETRGGSGVELLGDSALVGLPRALPARLNGGPVKVAVARGRTAQQAENVITSLPDSAPSVFVISLGLDDPSSPGVFADRIDELSLLLTGRTVYWITVPGRELDNRIVARQAATPGNVDAGGGWEVIDFAAAVQDHPSWWAHGQASAAGFGHLADTLNLEIGEHRSDAVPSAGGRLSGITVTSTTSSQTFDLDAERRSNAQTIVSVGERMGLPNRGLVIAVATAIQESKLVNLHGGAGGAYGLFQQTPSQGWGTIAQVEDPTYAASAFYRHLLTVPGWQSMALTDAAQAVQRSAYPDAYAQWEQSATVIVAALRGEHVAGCGPQIDVANNPKAQVAVNAALSQLGVPYSFAGGDVGGPTRGRCIAGTAAANDCQIVGFDCSGLMRYAWGQAGVDVPHDTGAMWLDPAFLHIQKIDELQPGDMVMFEPSFSDPFAAPGHTAMWLGGNRLVDAPHSGAHVRIETFSPGWYRDNFMGALRPKT